jgi:hypothetical protein
MRAIILPSAAEFLIHPTEQVSGDRRRALARAVLLSVSPFTHEAERSQEVSPLRAVGYGLVFTARLFSALVPRMGKEIFALSQRQKSFHSKALKSSPRKENRHMAVRCKCKPLGSFFFCNSKKFRRRGWIAAAYPGSRHRRGDPERLVLVRLHTNEQTRVEPGAVRWLCRQRHGRSLHGLETMASDHNVRS